MTARLSAILAMSLTLAACQTPVGPVRLGDMNQQRAFKLARDELSRRHLQAYADWRAEITDYNTIWVVTYYRPADRTDGPRLVRVSFNKHTEHLVAVDMGE
jgi:hypothetical protein